MSRMITASWYQQAPSRAFRAPRLHLTPKLVFDVCAAGLALLLLSPVLLLARGRSVIAYTGRVVDGGQPTLGVARASGRLLAHIVDRAPMVARIGIAGGDTSSLAVKALDLWALGFVGTLSPGVTLVRAHADDPRRDGLELMLKGGQMGSVDLFTRLRDGIDLGAAGSAPQ